MVNLEFTTTAMRRPDILDKTYASFVSKLTGINYSKSTLYINIEPFPDEVPIKDVIKVAQKYFGTVVPNFPKECNFTIAVKWCWSQVKGDYAFHLEDDWILMNKVKIAQLIRRCKDPVVQVALRAYSYTYNKIVLSPSLITGDFVRRVSEKLDITSNPEVQLRGDNVEGCFNLAFPNRIILKDTGRAWIKKSDYAKCSNTKYEFVAWKKN